MWSWAVRKKHWPLLIPIPVATIGYLLLQNLVPPGAPAGAATTTLSPKEILLHWGLKIIWGAALVLAGTLWWVVLRHSLTVSQNIPLPPKPNARVLLERLLNFIFPRKTWLRLWVGALISAVGVGFITLGISGEVEIRRARDAKAAKIAADKAAEIERLRALAEDMKRVGKLAVAVVSFLPVSSISAVEKTLAENISFWLTQELRMDNQAPLVVTEYADNPFVGKSAREHTSEHDEAREFARQEGKHLVIWGRVGSCEDGALVTPEFAAAYDWKGDVEIEDAVAYYKPDLERSHQQCGRIDALQQQTRDLARLILGVAYFRAKRWAIAIGHFRRAASEEARLWEALCYHEQAREADNGDWEKTKRAYQGVIQRLTDENTNKNNWLVAVARLELGDANQELPADSTDQRKQNLINAVREYEQSLEAYRRILPDDQAPDSVEEAPPWALQNNLGAAWFKLAQMEDNDQVARLTKAKEAFDAGLGLLDREAKDGSLSEEEAKESCALLYSNRASALAEWGRLLEERHEPGRAKLEAAKKDFENPLAESSNNVRQAKTLTNRANVLTQLAKLTAGLEGDNLIGEALEKYGVVLTKFEAGSMGYVFAQKARAEAYYDQGIRSGNVNSFEHARFDYNQTIPALQAHGPQEQFIDAREYLVKTLEQLVRIYDAPDPDGRTKLISTRQELNDARKKLQQARGLN